jgi:hypothetical protein
MKLFYHGKDGGPDSVVEGWWLVEIKSLFSISLLRFSNGSREAFHSHAFNSISWVLRGLLLEQHLNKAYKYYSPSFEPIVTKRNTFHKVTSFGDSWVLTFRGPWSKQWKEYIPKEDKFVTLESGRKIVE